LVKSGEGNHYLPQVLLRPSAKLSLALRVSPIE